MMGHQFFEMEKFQNPQQKEKPRTRLARRGFRLGNTDKIDARLSASTKP